MNSTRNNQNCVTPEKWMNDKNGSLFIKYIPNDITKTILRDIFGFLGKIARIDIVNISENGSGRRAFIHFHEWNNEPYSKLLRKSI
jgi:RNA recognition motif-containing protein